MKVRVGHLYPDYLNIYADRGNIAVLAERARRRGHELEVRPIGMRDPVPAGEIDLFYVGGGQDRDQELVAPDLLAKAGDLRAAVAAGAVVLGVCGGYQLLGRSYVDVAGNDLPGVGLLPLHTIAGQERMIGGVLLDCEWAGELLAGFENHAGRTLLDEGAEPFGLVLAGFGNDGRSGYEGCRAGRVYGTYLHGPLLPRNPWFADHLLQEALAHAGLETTFERLEDDLERKAFGVSAHRARSRGGKVSGPRARRDKPPDRPSATAPETA